MLAEDEVLVAMAVEDLLTEAGYRVTVADNGLDALQAYAADPADILVTDVRMPELDGLGLVAHLREQYPSLPVVIMTGHMVPSMVLVEPSQGRTAVFTKPVPNALLLDAVRASLPQSNTVGMPVPPLDGISISEGATH
nr:response regulator [Azospirillum sp. SYSU D00513]